MPSVDIIPSGKEFYELVHRTGVYGLRAYAHDVVEVLFDQLGVKGRRIVEEGIKRSRQVPDENGRLRDTAVFSALDYQAVEASVKRLFGRIQTYEEEIGLADVDPTTFVASGHTAT